MQHFVSPLGTALLIPLIWILHRRGYRKMFPCFFVYLVVVLFKSETLQLIKPFSRSAYFYGYWTAEAITVLLSFTVIYEIYIHILTSGTLPINRTTFFRISVGLLLFASVIAVFTAHTAGYSLPIRAIIVLSSTARSVQVGLFALLASLSIFFGFYWTGFAFGIALGYGLYALEELANILVRASVGTIGQHVYEFVTVLAYDCAILIWLAYALKAKESTQLDTVPRNDAHIWFGPLERVAK